MAKNVQKNEEEGPLSKRAVYLRKAKAGIGGRKKDSEKVRNCEKKGAILQTSL